MGIDSSFSSSRKDRKTWKIVKWQSFHIKRNDMNRMEQFTLAESAWSLLLAMEAELSEVSLDPSIAQAHQHNAGARKDGPPNEIWRSRSGPSTKIHAAVDAYGYPLYIMLSEGQRNDINYAIPVLEHINIKECNVLADRGYDSNKLIDLWPRRRTYHPFKKKC